MNNLTEIYKKAMVRSLVRIYVKTSILRKFYSVFPYLGRLNLSSSNDNRALIVAMLTENVKQFSFPIIEQLLQQLFTAEERNNMIEESINEILSNLHTFTAPPISIISELMNSFHLSNCETSNAPSNISGDKYVVNSLYLEKFIQFGGMSFPLSGISEFVNFSFTTLPIGLRLMFLPMLTLSEEKNALLVSDVNVRNKKINYIYSRIGTQSKKVFYPLLLAETFIQLTFDEVLQVTSARQIELIEQLKLDLTKTLDFRKLFEYILPISPFETLLTLDFLEQSKLLTEVYEKNKVYSVTNNLENNSADFHKALITMIQNLVNSENPNAL